MPARTHSARGALQLKHDYQIYTTCLEKAPGSLFLASLAKHSPFSQTFLKECGELAASLPEAFTAADHTARSLALVARQLWSVFGQTKVIEDGNRELCLREHTETPPNKELGEQLLSRRD